MKIQNDKLLPCPCCGSEIKGGVQLTGFGVINRQFIECDACGLKMETAYLIDEPILQSQLKAITKELITKWNTREPMKSIIEQLESEINDSKYLWDEDEYYTGRVHAFEIAKEIVEIEKGGVDNAG